LPFNFFMWGSCRIIVWKEHLDSMYNQYMGSLIFMNGTVECNLWYEYQVPTSFLSVFSYCDHHGPPVPSLFENNHLVQILKFSCINIVSATFAGIGLEFWLLQDVKNTRNLLTPIFSDCFVGNALLTWGVARGCRHKEHGVSWNSSSYSHCKCLLSILKLIVNEDKHWRAA